MLTAPLFAVFLTVAQLSPKPPQPWETAARIVIKRGDILEIGSGSVIASNDHESMILTCAHIFRDDTTRATAPRIRVDLFDGRLEGRKPAFVHYAESHPGERIDFDPASDVALVRIQPGKRIPASPVVPPSWRPRAQLQMIAVGCANGNDATAWTTHIKATDVRFSDSAGKPYQAIETTHAPRQGRSGGGLFTTDGYLAGVCDFADAAHDSGLYSAPSSIYRILNRNHLAHRYAPTPDDSARITKGD